MGQYELGPNNKTEGSFDDYLKQVQEELGRHANCNVDEAWKLSLKALDVPGLSEQQIDQVLALQSILTEIKESRNNKKRQNN